MSVEHTLKYGENPQQTVTLDEASSDPLALASFKTPDGASIASCLDQMSWVNLKDLSRGLDAITRAWRPPTRPTPVRCRRSRSSSSTPTRVGHRRASRIR